MSIPQPVICVFGAGVKPKWPLLQDTSPCAAQPALSTEHSQAARLHMPEQTNVTNPAQPSLRLIEKQTSNQKNPEERFSSSQYIRRGITPDSDLREEEIKDREGGSSLQHSISMQHQTLNLQKLCCRDIPASLMATLLPMAVATADEA